MQIEIQKAVENYIQMEADAQIIDMLRKGVITGVLREGTGWRVFANHTFCYRETLEDALVDVLDIKVSA